MLFFELKILAIKENCKHQSLPTRPLLACLQERIIKKIYLNPDNLLCFDRINIVCFGMLLDSVRITMSTCSTNYISTLSYDKNTKRCKISFNDKLKTLLNPKEFFQVYMHQLIHAFLYQHGGFDHGYDFKHHKNRIRAIMYDVYTDKYKGFKCRSDERGNNSYNHCAICPIDDISPGLPKPNKPVTDTNIVEPVRNDLSATNNARVSTGATNKTKTPVLKRNTNTTSTSVTKSLVTINKNNTARKSNNPTNVPNKTTTTNVQSTNKNIVTKKPLQDNANTTSTSVTKSLVTANKNNTVRKSSHFANVPIKTTTTNVQSTNKNIVTRKPLQGNANTASTSVTKSLVTANKNNTVSKESTSHVCLLCNVKLKLNESLREHLKKCTSSLFHDGSLNSFTIDEEDSKNQTILDEYPCPACMKLVKESKMNEHLDLCTQT